jgi:protocatechuate 3,4-dioxygenase beta subunit
MTLRDLPGDRRHLRLDVGDGQRFSNVPLTLPRPGSIAGRVTDARGEPVAYRTVRAFQRLERIDGSFGVRGLPVDATDAQGRYLIAGLPPGEYYVMASLDADSLARTFYPDAIRLDHAVPVTVRPADDVSGIDIHGREVPRSTVEGSVTSAPDGGGVMISLTSSTGEPDSRRTAAPDASGRFRIEGVPAGTFWLVAHPAQDAGAAATGATWTAMEIETTGRTVVRRSLALQPGYAIVGRVTTVRSDVPVGLAAARLQLQGLDERSRAALRGGAAMRPVAGAGDTVRFASVPAGPYRLIALPTDEMWPLSIEIDGESRLDGRFVVGPDSVPTFTVTYTDQPGVLDGAVRDAAGRALAGRIVVVFPADAARWSYSAGDFAADVSDADGRFEVKGLLPGPFLVGVLRRAAANPMPSRSLFESLAPDATAVTLPPAGRTTVAIVASGR